MAAISRKKPDPLHLSLRVGYEHYKAEVAGNDEDSAQTLAEVFCKARDWVYDHINGRTSFRFIDAPQWIRTTGDYSILDWLCAQVGVIAVRVPECSGLGCTARTVREFAAYLEQLSDARADGRTTQLEAAMIRKRGESAIAAIHAEIAHCERAVNGPRSMADAEKAS